MSDMDTLLGRLASDVALQQADDINRRIVDSCEDCLKILTLDGRVDYVNRAGLKHMDLSSPIEMLGRPWLEFWEPEDREAALVALESARAGTRGTFQGHSKTATGVLKWWNVAVTPITDTSGAVVQLLAVARDLTERQKEEAFRAGQHRVLEMIATGAALEDILCSLVHLLERQCDGMQCSFLLLDEGGHICGAGLRRAFRRRSPARSTASRSAPVLAPAEPRSTLASLSSSPISRRTRSGRTSGISHAGSGFARAGPRRFPRRTARCWAHSPCMPASRARPPAKSSG